MIVEFAAHVLGAEVKNIFHSEGLSHAQLFMLLGIGREWTRGPPVIYMPTCSYIQIVFHAPLL